jgi:hypothetical protein
MINLNGIPPRNNIIPALEYQPVRKYRQDIKQYNPKVSATQGKKMDFYA